MKTLWRSGAVFLAVCGAAVASGVTPVTWEQVGQAADELTFVQRITGFALTCPEAELERLLVAKPALPGERAQMVPHVMAEALLARNRGKALEFWRSKRAAVPAEIQGIFFTAFAETDAKGAVALLKDLEKDEAYPFYFYAVLGGVAKNDPEGAFKLAAEATVVKPAEAMMMVLGLIAQKNPEKAMALTVKLPEAEARGQMVGQVLGQWFSHSPEKALKWADGAKLPEDALGAFSWMYAEYARGHAEEAERWLAGLKDEQLKKALREAMMTQSTPAQLWGAAERDGWKAIPEHSLGEMIEYAGSLKPAEAARLFKSIPAERLKDKDDVVRITQAWAWVDGNAAAAWAEALPAGEVRESAILRMNTMWQMIDPKRALAQIEATPPGGLKAQLVRNVAVGLAKVNPTAAIEWINTQTDRAGKERALASLVEMGANRNPEETAQLLAKLDAGPARVKAYAEFMDNWAEHDPEGTMDWFLTLPAGAERKGMSQRVMSEVAGKVPEHAAAMLEDVTDPVERAQLATSLMTTYVPLNPEALPALLATMPQGEARNRALTEALGAIAARDPGAAVQYFQTAELGAQRADAIGGVARTWAQKDPAAAALWVAGFAGDTTLPKGKLAYAIGSVTREWAAVDPAASLAWVDTLQAGSSARTEATRSISFELVKTYPARAFDAMAREPSLARKSDAFSYVMTQWNKTDPEAAARHVQASTLPEATKTWLLSIKK